MAEAPNNPDTLTEARLRWLWAIALAATLVFASGNQPAAIPGSFVGLDKLAHFCLFGLLATLVLRNRAVWRLRGWRGVIAVAVVSAFGATDEWHQSFTPGRSVEFADWIADTAGAMLAVTLYLHWGWYRRLMETPMLRPRIAALARIQTPADTPASIGRE